VLLPTVTTSETRAEKATIAAMAMMLAAMVLVVVAVKVHTSSSLINALA
jgi:hypothetical protein